MTDKIIVFSNCGTEEEARGIGRALVEAKVAACVNIVAGVHSIYRWQGKVEEAGEWMLIIKSRRELFEPLCSVLRNVHSYQVPEVLAVPVVDGTEDYIDWIDRETARADSSKD